MCLIIYVLFSSKLKPRPLSHNPQELILDKRRRWKDRAQTTGHKRSGSLLAGFYLDSQHKIAYQRQNSCLCYSTQFTFSLPLARTAVVVVSLKNAPNMSLTIQNTSNVYKEFVNITRYIEQCYRSAELLSSGVFFFRYVISCP